MSIASAGTVVAALPPGSAAGTFPTLIHTVVTTAAAKRALSRIRDVLSGVSHDLCRIPPSAVAEATLPAQNSPRSAQIRRTCLIAILLSSPVSLC